MPGLLSTLIFLPALGAVCLLILRGDDHIWIRRLALTVSVAEFLLSLMIYSAMFVPIERLFALRPGQDVFRPAWRTDLIYFGVSALLLQLTTHRAMTPFVSNPRAVVGLISSTPLEHPWSMTHATGASAPRSRALPRTRRRNSNGSSRSF